MSQMDLTCVEVSACGTEKPIRNGIANIYLRDTQTNTTRRITNGYAGGDPDGPSYHPAISGDGRYVAFASQATNLTRDSIRRGTHVYVHDLVTGVTEIITRTPSGRPANGASLRPTLSHDGSRIGFQSLAGDLVCQGKCQPGQADINLLWDVFVYDRSTRRMTRASADNGVEWMENSRAPSLDNSGRVLTFGSRHPINERDEGHDEDLYVYRLR
jgi:Tol biopolymer transport system component